MKTLSNTYITEQVQQTFTRYHLRGKRLLVIIPDNTRSAPIDRFFSLFYDYYYPELKQLDYLIALGTHALLTDEQKYLRVGITEAEKKEKYSSINIYNHLWQKEETFTTIGTISASDMAEISEGSFQEQSEISLNKMIFDYDAVLVIGPVFPHEIAGFSGYTKYLFPGICGWNFIDDTHWLGALKTNIDTIGNIDTPARRMMNKAASLVTVPVIYFNLVVDEEGLKGLFVGDSDDSWRQAANLSAEINISYEPQKYDRVFSVASSKYEDYWTGAKAFYKLEPIIADGGEIVVYAPHINEISFTHDDLLRKIGFHVVDYFKAHLDDKYCGLPKTALAYSALVKGKGRYEYGRESTRISHKLAVGIPRERLESINLEWADYHNYNIGNLQELKAEGFKVVMNAGETLYKSISDQSGGL